MSHAKWIRVALAAIPSRSRRHQLRPRGAPEADSWTSLDRTKLSPAERRFVEDSEQGHHADAVIEATFGGGNPNRLLDFPPAR